MRILNFSQFLAISLALTIGAPERGYSEAHPKRQIPPTVNHQSNLAEHLACATLESDWSRAASLIKDGASIETGPRKYTDTPLILASKFGRFEIVQLLVREGANINSPSRSGETPLGAACENGNFSVARFLLNQGARINPPANFNSRVKIRNPLYLAIENMHRTIIELLLRKGADVNQVDFEGMAPLHHAISFSSPNVVTQLMRYGANVNLRAPLVGSPLTYALSLNRIRTTKPRTWNKMIWALLSPQHLHKYEMNTLEEALLIADQAGLDWERLAIRDAMGLLEDHKEKYRTSLQNAKKRISFYFELLIESLRVSAGGQVRNNLEYEVLMKFLETLTVDQLPGAAKALGAGAYAKIEETRNKKVSRANFEYSLNIETYNSNPEKLRELAEKIMIQISESRWARISPEKKQFFHEYVGDQFLRVLRENSEDRLRSFSEQRLEDSLVRFFGTREFIEAYDPMESNLSEFDSSETFSELFSTITNTSSDTCLDYFSPGNI